MKVPFQTVDVFTDRKFGGNPLAVIPDAQGLTAEQMQSIAAEFNLAETTFVLPPRDPKNTAHVRIFTPKSELPFAGHPNVGTAFVLARHGRSGDRFVFEEGAGLVPLDLTRESGVVVSARLAAPQPLSLVETVPANIVAQAAGLQPGDIVGEPVVASTGNKFLFAELRSREALKTASYNTEIFRKHLPMERTVGLHLYVTGTDIQSRMFAPLFGVPEDPATGSANITLIGLLALRDPRPDLTLSKTIGQGVDMGRPSVLEATAEKKAGKVTATYIGGGCVPMLSGIIEI
ncbi:MAG TPA: PhzF family phenazine biosynthesis protein [Reyranella sp.]|jgi:trans-2,3-dihydro-3-hydroxyanthranilate isomerase|nr:PhzF family phenazine biosynthesis protein [Reyranella sp.]